MEPIDARRALLGLVAVAPLTMTFRLATHPAPAAAADDFPVRPIRMVVPFTPGGGTDVVGRKLAEDMERLLGQTIVVDNKPGAGTVIGSDLVAKAPADGYTLLLTTSALAINDSLVRKLPYQTDKDFIGVGLICTGPNVLVVKPDSPYKSVKDIVAAAKANPGKLTYGSSGNGSSVHLTAELFKIMAGIDIIHVPYKGAGPAYTDLMGGQIDLVFGTAGGVSKLVEGGRMRALAVTSAQRTRAYQDVPTIAETIPGYESNVWYGIFAPAGTPPDRVARLNGALRRAAGSPEYIERLAADGLTVSVGTPEQMTQFLRDEQARWRKVVTEGKISVD